MSGRWIFGTTVTHPIGLTSTRFTLPAGGGNQLAVASPAANGESYIAFGDSTITATLGDTNVPPGTKAYLDIPAGTTHYAIIGTTVGNLHFRGREATLPPTSTGNFFDVVPLTLGRSTNAEGVIDATGPSPTGAGRWFAFTGSFANTLAASWDMEDPRINLADGATYHLQCTLRARVISTGLLYTENLQFIMRMGSHIDLWDQTGTITGVSNNTTAAGFVFINTNILYNSINHYLGCVPVNVPPGVRIEISDVVIEPFVQQPDPWDDIPNHAARTLNVDGNLMPNDDTLATPLLIPPGATEVNMRVTYNGTISGEIMATAYVYLEFINSIGFVQADLAIPTTRYYWRPGDDVDVWITVPIINPRTTTGNQFILTFRSFGLSSVKTSAIWRIDPAGVTNTLPGTMPTHRPPYFLDTTAATPVAEADMENMVWSDTGFENNGIAGVDPPCWRSRYFHGYVQGPGGNNENGLYTNTDAFPGVAITPHALEVDSNDRPFLRLHSAKFPAPVLYGGNPYPFQACVLTTQKLTQFNNRLGIWRTQLVAPSQEGAWSAFWCIGQRTNTDPRQSIWPPEIDFFENFNGAYGTAYTQYTTSSAQHVGAHGTGIRAEISGLATELNHMGFPASFNNWSQIHDYACLVTEDWITHFVDGIETLQHRNMTRDPSGTTAWAFYPIINIAVKALDTSTYDTGTPDMLVYGIQHFNLTGYTLTPYAETAPYDNLQILPGPDLRFTLSATFTGTGDITSAAISGAIFQDDFNRPDEALNVSANWTVIGTNVNKLLVAGNAINHSSLSIGPLYTSPDFGVANHFVEAIFKYVGAGVQGYLCVRATDLSNFIGVRVINTYAELRKVVAGVNTVIGSSTAAINDVFRIEASGTTITLKKNGTTVATVTVTDTVLQTATKCGLYGLGGGASPWIDDYKSGPL